MKKSQNIKNSNKDHTQDFIKTSATDKPNFFNLFSQKVAEFVGTASVFICMLIFVLIWLISGPIFGFSDTWQLIINTTTSVITFLIVFIIQSTQNRDTKAMKLKLDELIRSHTLAHNSIIDLDKLSDNEIKELEQHYSRISKKKDDDCEKESSKRLKDEED